MTLFGTGNAKVFDVLGQDITEAEAFAFINGQLKNAFVGIFDLLRPRVATNTDTEKFISQITL